MSKTESNPIVLYDGVCGLCNHLVQFLLRHDTHDRFRFASLQSEFADNLLSRHGANAHDLDTVYVVKDYGLPSENLLTRSDAVVYMLMQLGGFWKLAAAGQVLPRAVRDAAYQVVVRNRYRVFGKHESCILPNPEHRDKFLEV